MTKVELVNVVAEKLDFTKKDTKAVIDAAIETIIEAVAKDEKVALVGFGTFEGLKRAEREGRNPATGETMIIPAKTTPKFKPGKSFKDAVNA